MIGSIVIPAPPPPPPLALARSRVARRVFSASMRRLKRVARHLVHAERLVQLAQQVVRRQVAVLELLAVRADLVVDELPHRVADHLQLFGPFEHGPHRTRSRPESDNGHVRFTRPSSRSSRRVTRARKYWSHARRAPVDDLATDQRRRTPHGPDAARDRTHHGGAVRSAMAGVVSLPVPACPIDRRWQRDTNGPFDRSDLASARYERPHQHGAARGPGRDRARTVVQRRDRARHPAGRARASTLERTSAADVVRIRAPRRRRAPPTDRRHPATIPPAAPLGARHDLATGSPDDASPGPSVTPRMDGPGGVHHVTSRLHASARVHCDHRGHRGSAVDLGLRVERIRAAAGPEWRSGRRRHHRPDRVLRRAAAGSCETAASKRPISRRAASARSRPIRRSTGTRRRATARSSFWDNHADGGSVPTPLAAADGDQIAEFNANVPGALYQDVPTIPGEQYLWSLSRIAGAAVPTRWR